MAIPTFFHPHEIIADSVLTLSPEESAHATGSRRLRSGDAVQIINGEGFLGQGVLREVNKRQTIVELTKVQFENKQPTTLSIATAIPKGDRQKVMVDMLTQIGIHRIIPLHCEYSATLLRPAMSVKWQRIVVEACKQSQRTWRPGIEQPLTLLECLQQNNQVQSQLLFADRQGISIAEIRPRNPREIIVFIGPEGGFSETELKQLIRFEAQPISFAKAILRTETACVVATAQLAERLSVNGQ